MSKEDVHEPIKMQDFLQVTGCLVGFCAVWVSVYVLINVMFDHFMRLAAHNVVCCHKIEVACPL